MPTLDWIGKQAVVNHHREVPTRLLHCDGDLSFGDPDAGNLLVEGDNLEALKALLPFYAGKVKCIYIDPPYNTGNEGWVYNDNVNSPEIRAWLEKVVGKEGEDLSRHDKWLCMMYPRLRLLRDFLVPGGVVFASCDGHELANLALLGRDMLGLRELSVVPVVNNLKGRNDKANIATAHEYLLIFSSSKFVSAGLPMSEQQRRRFRFRDENGDPYEARDLRKRGGNDTRRDRPNMFYPLYIGESGNLSTERRSDSDVEILPYKSDGQEGRWRWEKSRVERYLPWLAASYVKRSERWGVTYRVYLDPGIDLDPDGADEEDEYDDETGDAIERSTKPKSFWWGPELSTDRASKHLKSVIGANRFPYPKPVDLIWRAISMAGDVDCLVMDSFAGSGTTGEAVLKANEADGQRRKFILVELDRNIAQGVTRERLGKVAERYGSGFRYCTLGKALLDEWGSINAGVTFPDLAAFTFFSETGSPIPARATEGDSRLGAFAGRAIHLLWSPESAGRADASAGNVLTLAALDALAPHDGPRIVYAEGCTVSAERLAAAGVTFKHVPYQLGTGT